MPADIVKNSTSISTQIRILSFEGFPATTIAFNTVGLDVWYRRDGGLKISISLSALAAANSAYVDGGFIHVGAGYYRVDIPNAALVAGSNGVLVTGDLNGFKIEEAYHALTEPAGGSGAYIVTVTVNDQAALPLQNASVRLSEGVNTLILTTNVSGIATFSVNAATWDVTITKTGYTFTPTTLVVSGNTSPTYAMTQTTTPAAPAGPLLSTGRTYAYGVNGLIASGVKVYFRQTVGLGFDGAAWSNAEFSVTSTATGLIEYNGFVRNAVYVMRREKGRNVQFVVPNSVSFDLPEVVGPFKT